MQTLAHGHNDPVTQRGYSLLEVLVVLVIIGIVTGAASLGIRAADDTRKLHVDARRLAHFFSLAQAEARKRGMPVVWQYDHHGYHFTQVEPTTQLPAALSHRLSRARPEGLDQSGPLRARAWSTPRPVQVRVDPPMTEVFAGEWVSGPQRVRLHDGLSTVALERAGNGQYRVLP